MLVRWRFGEHKIWSIVIVILNAVEAVEDGRQLHRELIQLKSERTCTRIGSRVCSRDWDSPSSVDAKLPARLESLRQWDDQGIPEF